MNIEVNLSHSLKNHAFGDLSKPRSLGVLLRNIFQVLNHIFDTLLKTCHLGIFLENMKTCHLGIFLEIFSK